MTVAKIVPVPVTGRVRYTRFTFGAGVISTAAQVPRACGRQGVGDGDRHTGGSEGGDRLTAERRGVVLEPHLGVQHGVLRRGIDRLACPGVTVAVESASKPAVETHEPVCCGVSVTDGLEVTGPAPNWDVPIPAAPT